MVRNSLLLPLIIISILYSCTQKSTENQYVLNDAKPADTLGDQLFIQASKVLKPLPSVILDSSATSLAKFQLGKLLYYDVRLSKNNTISCNSCHNLAKFGVDNEPTSEGAFGVRGGRNSPTSLNAFLHIAQFWDGRAKDVEAQAQGPILNPVEMACPNGDYVVEKVAAIPGYISLYREAFPGSAMNYQNITASIGYFERFLVTPSPFDRFLEGDVTALDNEEKKGLKIFLETGCQSCHMGVTVGGSIYEKFGKYDEYWKHTGSSKQDEGIFALTKNEADRYKFKVPSLRNVSETGPYFHDGSVKDLKNAVKIMAKVQLNKDLSDADAVAVVAFLKSLTGQIPAYALQ